MASGITFVAVHFDGYGDDAITEEVKCYAGEWYASDEHEPVQYDASLLQEHFEALVPFGYENDCGGAVLQTSGAHSCCGREREDFQEVLADEAADETRGSGKVEPDGKRGEPESRPGL